MKYRLASYVLFAFILYTVGSFMAWNLNPGTWWPEGRLMCGCLFLTALVGVEIIAYMESTKP
jgi:hypothetical protein